MKKFFVFLFSVFFAQASFADPLDSCFKSYNKSADEIFMQCVSAINQNKYEILEIQSGNGYILFRANLKDYLLTVSNKTGGSNVKIVPANSNFSGGLMVQSAIFALIDSNPAYGFKKVQ